MPTQQVSLSLSPYYSLAFAQNNIPLIVSLQVRREATDPPAPLKLILSSEQQLFPSLEHALPPLPADDWREVTDLRPAFSKKALAGYSEAIADTISLELWVGKQRLARVEEQTRILPLSHWTGYATAPTLLAAHVQPNDRHVAKLLSRAAKSLASQSEGLAMDGYQSGNPRRVARQVAAVAGAIQELKLSYVGVPASFENYGQKIRPAKVIMEDHLANCLDLSVLGAAVLEQAGLHPVIVLIKAHAYLACWLVPTPVRTGYVSDAQALRKALRAGHLLSLEMTLLCNTSTPLNEVLEQGKTALLSSKDFQAGVDVHAARTGERVHPLALPSVRAEQADQGEAAGSYVDLASSHIPESITANQEAEAEPVATGMDRIDRWKAKLLDLTRRNRLLNWRATGGAVPLPFIAGGKLEDILAGGKALRIESVYGQAGEDHLVKRRLDADHYRPVIEAGLAKRTILVQETPQVLRANLLKLERASRLALEEGGSNTLYCAIGFAVKTRRDQEMPPYGLPLKAEHRPEYLAPLILLPLSLTRTNASAHFSIRQRDEEAFLNPTFQEYLRGEEGVEFAGLTNELPADDSGVDVAAILKQVRTKLSNVAGWEVLDEVAIGHFSFAKYLMWRDLDAFTEDLRGNPVVAHLIDAPRQPYYEYGDERGTFRDKQTMDQWLPAAEQITPLSADASQLVAVDAASRGMDFVLEGPPGTGKSQTITNLIAHTLAQGKSVLFVSEKTAALEVVERRLIQIGLGDSTLELHSNKVTKTAVYDQLRQSLGSVYPSDTEFTTVAAEYQARREELTAVVDAIHHEGPLGKSVFAMVAFAANHLEVSAPRPPAALLDKLAGDSLRSLSDLVKRTATFYLDVAPAARPALWQLRRLEPDTEAILQKAIDVAKKLRQAAAELSSTLSLPSLWEPDQLSSAHQLATLLNKAEGRDYAFGGRALEGGRARRALAAEVDSVVAINEAYHALSTSFTAEVKNFDARQASRDWSRAEQAFILLRWWQQFWLARQLNGYAMGKSATPGGDLERLSKMQRARGELSVMDANFAWTAEGLAEQQAMAEWVKELTAWAAREETQLLGLTAAGLTRLLDDLAENNTAARRTLSAATDFSEAYTDFHATAEHLNTRLITKLALEPVGVEQLATEILRYRGEWRAYDRFAESRAILRERGLDYLIDAENNDWDKGSAAAGVNFRLGVYRSVIDKVVEQQPLLKRFSGSHHESLIEYFSNLDQAWRTMAEDELHARLAKKRDGIYRQEFRSALGVLQQELQKKRRQLPVRQLIRRLGGLLPELTPCLLMSPLSVAQYLPADDPNVRFDLVVFDEASQIPVWDAVGAIARGRQVVVVGDSKQLPPTSFFNKSDDELDIDPEADELVVEDMESILDELKAAQLPTHMLKWHYRSRAESLITFSNRTYYGNDLYTFPAPVAEDRAVQWHKIDSHDYHKGTNKVEAKALVDYLIPRLARTPISKRTFGVVTFNSSQQRVIEDLLEEARREHPAIEPHFADHEPERLFVKNIENVQGDERDVILFSITYGRDAAGKLAMRFGPMNQSGGERRLNVAVTRARHEMHLFSSIEPEDIKRDRLGAAAQGARDLKGFLLFARNGMKGLAGRIESVGNPDDYDSPFEEAVAQALRTSGYTVDCQVGVAGYRIDLGVQHPDHPGRYLLGVECDGASYHGSATARERDLLRQQVLEGLGWSILRVWSLDWWYERDKTLTKLLERIDHLYTTAQEEAPASSEPVATKPPAKSQAASAPASVTVQPTHKSVANAELRAHLPMPPMDPSFEQAFYDRRLDESIRAIIKALLQAEAPLTEDVLRKRLGSDVLNFSRMGSRIQSVLDELISKSAYVKEFYGEPVYYAYEQQAGSVATFRAPAEDDQSPRGIADIPKVELAALVKELLREGLLENDLIRAVGHRVGVKSVRGSSRSRIKEVIDAVWQGSK